jgi:hypothetical protein
LLICACACSRKDTDSTLQNKRDIPLTVPTQNKTDINSPVPIQKNITIKTEINRAASAFYECFNVRKDVDDYPNRMIGCFNTVKNENLQKNTYTDPFMLGLSFYTWVFMHGFYDTSGYVKLITVQRYDEFRKFQNKLNVSDEDLCVSSDVLYDKIKPDLEIWEKNINNYRK